MNYRFDFEEKEDRIKKIRKEIIKWIIEIGIVIGLAYLLVVFAAEKTTVTGNSMETTLQDQDKILINKFAYGLMKPDRFDVVVFKQNGREHSYYNIKRIIGLPGETIKIMDGIVYINGEALEEKFETERITNGGVVNEEILLDEDEYFVLGDNRNYSEDSRFANIGNITSDDIVGKAWIRFEPFSFISQIRKTHSADKSETEKPATTE